jgi:hypothetical protein
MTNELHNTRRALLCALPAGLAASAAPAWAKETLNKFSRSLS